MGFGPRGQHAILTTILFVLLGLPPVIISANKFNTARPCGLPASSSLIWSPYRTAIWSELSRDSMLLRRLFAPSSIVDEGKVDELRVDIALQTQEPATRET